MCQCTKSQTLIQPSYRHKLVLLPEAICCCLHTCKCGLWYCVPVYQISKSGTLIQPSYRHKLVYCLRLFVVVYKLVNVVLTLEWYCVPVYQVS